MYPCDDTRLGNRHGYNVVQSRFIWAAGSIRQSRELIPTLGLCPRCSHWLPNDVTQTSRKCGLRMPVRDAVGREEGYYSRNLILWSLKVHYFGTSCYMYCTFISQFDSCHPCWEMKKQGNEKKKKKNPPYWLLSLNSLAIALFPCWWREIELKSATPLISSVRCKVAAMGYRQSRGYRYFVSNAGYFILKYLVVHTLPSIQ